MIPKVLAAAILSGSSFFAQGQCFEQIQAPSQHEVIENRIDALRSDTLEEVQTYAAWDIGSGATKITVADVNVVTNKIVKIWHQSLARAELRQDLKYSGNNRLSPEIEQHLINTLLSQKEIAAKYKPVKWLGVGTSVFRTAGNSQEFLDRVIHATGINILIVPQAEEGKIGFNSAVGSSGEDPKNTISWDSGSGSFQIAALIGNELEVYGAEFATVPALEALFANRNQPFSDEVNPVYQHEALELIETIRAQLPAVPEWICETNKRVVALGDSGSIFAAGTRATGSSTFNKHQIMEAILLHCGKTDAELLPQFVKEIKEVMVGLIIIYTVMDHCEIEEISYTYTNGGCEGLLLMSDYWE